MISFFHSPLTMHTSLPVQEMPSPSPRDKGDHANEAKRRLKREVIHRLASGNKTHSEMAEVKTVSTCYQDCSFVAFHTDISCSLLCTPCFASTRQSCPVRVRQTCQSWWCKRSCIRRSPWWGRSQEMSKWGTRRVATAERGLEWVWPCLSPY